MANRWIKKGDGISLTEDERKYIRLNCQRKNDSFIAVHLGVSKNIVNYYRRQVLRIIKPNNGRPKDIRGSLDFEALKHELKAIQCYANFPGLMNGAKDRVKYIESVINGVR